MATIYLDHAATTPLDPRAAAAMEACWRSAWGNPSSQHRQGAAARRALDEARDDLARRLGLSLAGQQPDRLIVTSGGTEANQLALRGLAGKPPGRIAVLATEHPSVLQTAAAMRAEGWELDLLPVDAAGLVDLGALDAALARGLRLVSVQLANSETGVVQPLAQVAERCRARGALLHTDAVQAVGKLPLDFRALGVDALSLAAHKFHGPLGVGGLCIRGGVPLEPQMLGGAQQAGLRAGTEPVPLVVGMAAALAAWLDDDPPRGAVVRARREQFESLLRAALPDVVVHGAAAPRLPHIAAVALPGVDRQALLVALDLAGVACSTGSACSSGASNPSPTLAAMGLPRPEIEASLRFSFGPVNTPADVDQAARHIVRLVNDLRRAVRPGKNAPSGRGPDPARV